MLGALKDAYVAWHRRAIHGPRAERVANALSQQIGQAESLLDVGCCAGNVAERIGRDVGAKRIAGVDVVLQPEIAIEARLYDGRRIPYGDGEFEAVVVSDVLHHCEDPFVTLKECVRVARRVLVIKDHFAFGPVSSKILLYMDQVGNAENGVGVPGTYFRPEEWVDMIHRAGGKLAALHWPLKVHDMPWRLVTRSELQFVARVEPMR